MSVHKPVITGASRCPIRLQNIVSHLGPWNIHEGADPFGPPVRESFSFDEKVDFYRDLGFVGIQFHDDDVVPDIDDKTHAQLISRAKSVKTQIDNHGLTAEVIAPRLWESPLTIDGAYTSNSEKERQYALERSKRCVDIANVLECKNFVLWLAREGTYIRETKSSADAVGQILDAINALLEYDSEIRILIEPKPNEPMDIAYIPTIGHAIGLAYASQAPDRVGGLIESAPCYSRRIKNHRMKWDMLYFTRNFGVCI